MTEERKCTQDTTSHLSCAERSVEEIHQRLELLIISVEPVTSHHCPQYLDRWRVEQTAGLRIERESEVNEWRDHVVCSARRGLTWTIDLPFKQVSKNSSTSSWINSSFLLLPKPKSRRWRSANLLLSTQYGPSVNMIPAGKDKEQGVSHKCVEPAAVKLYVQSRERRVSRGKSGRPWNSSFFRASITSSAPHIATALIEPNLRPITEPYFSLNLSSCRWKLFESRNGRDPMKGRAGGPARQQVVYIC